jgi:hypothetical protein
LLLFPSWGRIVQLVNLNSIFDSSGYIIGNFHISRDGSQCVEDEREASEAEERYVHIEGCPACKRARIATRWGHF